MNIWRHIPASGAVVAFMCLTAAAPAPAAESIKLSGVIEGLVTNGDGIPQLGAAVSLFNRHDKLFAKVITGESGNFAFAGLIPDVYSIRVTLASFVPAIKRDILVQPGMRSTLNVSMATLFSSIHLVYPTDHPAFMSDDWKWVLRTASSTRPIMRLLPDVPAPAGDQTHRTVFSDTRGLVMLSAGDGSLVSGFGSSADMGTAFALATSLFGANQVQFAGNVGSGAQSGIPSAAFRSTYSRDVGPDSPEVSVTMRELFLPGRMGLAIFGTQDAVPMLRSVSASVDDHASIGDAISLQYGVAFDSVSFNDRTHYLSPYALLSYSLGTAGEVNLSYTSGNPHQSTEDSSIPADPLQHEVNALGLFPLVSLRAGQAEVQRGTDVELGYLRKAGSRKFAVSAYRQAVSNLALTISSPAGLLPVGDILPDFFSGTSMFNAGNFAATGYTASATQNLGDNLSATVIYGSSGALTASNDIVDGNPDNLRAMIHASRQQSVTFRVTAISRRTGTHIMASYQIADSRLSVPDPTYSTSSLRPQPGLNIYLRQAIPAPAGLPWRMEVTADLRNLLQQGYLPLATTDGSPLVLMETPRMVRGGLSFIF